MQLLLFCDGLVGIRTVHTAPRRNWRDRTPPPRAVDSSSQCRVHWHQHQSPTAGETSARHCWYNTTQQDKITAWCSCRPQVQRRTWHIINHFKDDIFYSKQQCQRTEVEWLVTQISLSLSLISPSSPHHVTNNTTCKDILWQYKKCFYLSKLTHTQINLSTATEPMRGSKLWQTKTVSCQKELSAFNV